MSIIPDVLLIFLLSAAISFLTSLANRLLSNPEQTRTWRKEIGDWNSELRKAKHEKDDKRVEKLLKKQQYIMQLQGKMTWQSMKVSLLFIIPLFLIWQVLPGYLSGKEIAVFPGLGYDIPIPLFGVSLLWWYMVSSMLFSTVFSHALGIMAISE